MNILLQILDEGRISDSHGKKVNFENTIICMTSNAGSSTGESGLGFGKTSGDLSKEKAMKALKEFLRPEFLGRVDEVVVFNPLTVENYADIAKLQLEDTAKALAENRRFGLQVYRRKGSRRQVRRTRYPENYPRGGRGPDSEPHYRRRRKHSDRN